MSVTEPSDAVNAGMTKETEGGGLARKRKSPPYISSLVGWFGLDYCFHLKRKVDCSQGVMIRCVEE